MYVQKGLTVHMKEWEDNGWYGVENKSLVCDAVARLRARSAPTTFRWVKGHSGVPGNEGADELARHAVERKLTKLLPAPPLQFVASGFRLASITQKLAYKRLRNAAQKGDRQSTQVNIDAIQEAADDFSQWRPTTAAIWLAIWKLDCDRKIRAFWWKMVHNAHRIGGYWAHISGYEQRAKCPYCNAIETMAHLVCECPCPWRLEVWSMAMALLAKRKILVDQFEFGHMLAAGSLKVVAADGAERPADTRLLRTVLTELVYLIWVMRCEWVIGRDGSMDRTFSAKEASERWLWRLNRRLKLDVARTKFPKHRGMISKLVVVGTWRGLLLNEHNLPDDWTSMSGVLVGKHIRALRQGVG
ncbi:hypothetical protein C8T65DRAFT_566487 [Cerioporus squamosus]|nr:hypothetical protein C8T65DRAFT_566487 [Cerioporus squamosus]